MRITELGAGSADKTRILLKAAVAQQGTVVYEPVDVSASALETAKERIEREIPEVLVAPRVKLKRPVPFVRSAITSTETTPKIAAATPSRICIAINAPVLIVSV